MKMSDSIGALAAALATAQAEIKAVQKDSTNPHFKNSYASLDTILENVRPTLAKHGLSLLQGASTPHTDDTGRVTAFAVETMLLHKSGEYVTNTAVMPLAKHDPQGAGGALTYGRRYGVSALLALATEDDDDGHAASAPARAQQIVQASVAAAPASNGNTNGNGNGNGNGADGPSPVCPDCGGPMWDNRAKKTNPKAPDWRCKRKGECEGVIWPPKSNAPAGTATASAPARAAGATTTAKRTTVSEPIMAEPDPFDVDAYAPDDALPF